MAPQPLPSFRTWERSSLAVTISIDEQVSPRADSVELLIESLCNESQTVWNSVSRHCAAFGQDICIQIELLHIPQTGEKEMPYQVSPELSRSDTVCIDEGDTQGTIGVLVKDLHVNSVTVQRNAVTTLRLLTKLSMENRILIGNSAIGPLVALSQSNDLQIQENAVTALLNLSINDNNKSMIAAAGAIDALVHVLKVGTSEAKDNSAATLFSLSHVDKNKLTIGQSGAIPLLIDLLKHSSPQGKKDSVRALFNLSLCHANIVKFMDAGATRTLVELITDPASGMVDKAAGILANLACTSEGRRAICEGGGIPALVDVVELGSQRGKEYAAAALLQLSTNSCSLRDMVLQEGATPYLLALSQSGTSRAREKARSLLRLFMD